RGRGRGRSVRRCGRKIGREARRRSRAPLWRGAAAAAPDLVLDAGRDSLRVSGEAFARELAAAGVVMRYVVVPDTSHGFLDRPAEPIGRGTDRKSTRLNSSHVKISYAVFCLKKKKKKTKNWRKEP